MLPIITEEHSSLAFAEIFQNVDEWRKKMNRINDCLECRSCASKCPYGLDTPELLKVMLQDYNEFYEIHKND